MATLIETIAESTRGLPAMPAVSARVVQMLRDPEIELAEVVELLRLDPAIAAKIQQIANSAFMSRPERASTLQAAVMRLGLAQVYNLVVALGLSGAFVQSGPLGKALWRHSLAVAFVARNLARKAKSVDPEIAFLAGLLHDCGRIVLVHQFPDAMGKALELIRTQELSSIEAEQETFEFTHTELGSALADTWGFPQDLQRVIAGHHEPELVQPIEVRVLARLTEQSDALCTARGYNLYTLSEYEGDVSLADDGIADFDSHATIFDA